MSILHTNNNAYNNNGQLGLIRFTFPKWSPNTCVVFSKLKDPHLIDGMSFSEWWRELEFALRRHFDEHISTI